VLDASTGPSSVANCGLNFVFDLWHPKWPFATVFQAKMKELIARRDSRDKNPHLNNTEALLARRKMIQGTKART
jgi:hypothetical protein